MEPYSKGSPPIKYIMPMFPFGAAKQFALQAVCVIHGSYVKVRRDDSARQDVTIQKKTAVQKYLQNILVITEAQKAHKSRKNDQKQQSQ